MFGSEASSPYEQARERCEDCPLLQDRHANHGKSESQRLVLGILLGIFDPLDDAEQLSLGVDREFLASQIP